MKYFVEFYDEIYKSLMTIDELAVRFNTHHKIYLNNNYSFEKEKLNLGDLMSMCQYTDIYELETELNLPQVKQVIEHDFYVDVVGLLNVVGRLKEIK